MDESIVNTPAEQMELQADVPLENNIVEMQEVKENDVEAQYTGQCKWFNNSYGYGFLTICDGPDKGMDIFVHWEGIKPLNSLYKTLKKGEYVIFDVVDSDKGKQAVNVRGICNGPLLCDHIQIKKSGVTGDKNETLPNVNGINPWNTVPYKKQQQRPNVGSKRPRRNRPDFV